MIRHLGDAFTRFSLRWMPHPFVFAILLTLIAFLLALAWARVSPGEAVTAWYSGMWNGGLLTFAFQMAMILVTGHALAETPPVRRVLAGLARRVHGTGSAVVLTSLVAMIAALLNWGLGLIVGALLARTVAREAARRDVRVHYPLVVAAGYTGLLIWHGGLSGTAPVTIATPGHFLEARIGVIPVSETLLSPLNLAVTGFLLLAVPLALMLMAPRPDRIETAPREPEPPPPRDPAPGALGPTPAQRLENSRSLVLIMALAGLGYLVPYFLERGWDGVNLNAINFVFLLAGLLLHGTPRRYADSVDEAVRGAGGILLQFPFYFGIMGLMSGTGLTERFAEASVSLASSAGEVLPVGSVHAVMTFLGAAVVNLFVPSGGGQWSVQGPIAVEAAERLGTQLTDTVMAVAYGDELTNMLQPFWALPLLAITRLQARQIVGYTSLLMLLVAPGILVLLALFGAGPR